MCWPSTPELTREFMVSTPDFIRAMRCPAWAILPPNTTALWISGRARPNLRATGALGHCSATDHRSTVLPLPLWPARVDRWLVQLDTGVKLLLQPLGHLLVHASERRFRRRRRRGRRRRRRRQATGRDTGKRRRQATGRDTGKRRDGTTVTGRTCGKVPTICRCLCHCNVMPLCHWSAGAPCCVAALRCCPCTSGLATGQQCKRATG
jgi:hypothetical protein